MSPKGSKRKRPPDVDAEWVEAAAVNVADSGGIEVGRAQVSQDFYATTKDTAQVSQDLRPTTPVSSDSSASSWASSLPRTSERSPTADQETQLASSASSSDSLIPQNPKPLLPSPPATLSWADISVVPVPQDEPLLPPSPATSPESVYCLCGRGRHVRIEECAACGNALCDQCYLDHVCPSCLNDPSPVDT